MPDRRLVAAFADVAANLVPEELIDSVRTTRAVARQDATLRPEVVGTALLLPLSFHIAGPAAAGSNVSTMIRLPQNALVSRIDADAKIAPSGGEFTAQLTADGATVEGARVSIADGATRGGTNVGTALAAGAGLGINVTAANGAADISLTVTVRVTS